MLKQFWHRDRQFADASPCVVTGDAGGGEGEYRSLPKSGEEGSEGQGNGHDPFVFLTPLRSGNLKPFALMTRL